MYAKFSIRDEKSEKCPRFSKKVYYLSQMQILHIKLYILILSCSLCLRHLNYLKCPCLSFLSIFFFWGYYLDFFTKNTVFFIANADFTYLAIYYNLTMQFMSCDTYVMLNTHVS